MSPLDLIVWAIAILIAAVCLMLATFAIVGAVRYVKVNRAAWRG